MSTTIRQIWTMNMLIGHWLSPQQPPSGTSATPLDSLGVKPRVTQTNTVTCTIEATDPGTPTSPLLQDVDLPSHGLPAARLTSAGLSHPAGSVSLVSSVGPSSSGPQRGSHLNHHLIHFLLPLMLLSFIEASGRVDHPAN
ncbi:hypothetical protein M9H77_02957 [Catharanthus roseus]|uniref:Uncharacterized protein n=1 Tax=Catharanthus roseus TaxID=4058 RepID=A0ACC0CA20_CATRO|nr:hypothetical protein M9H77_02957 [Catharanthus roseus]